MSLAHRLAARAKEGTGGSRHFRGSPAFGQVSSCELCGDLPGETVDCAPVAAVAFGGMDGLDGSPLGEPQSLAVESPGKHTMLPRSRQLHELCDVRRLRSWDEGPPLGRAGRS